MSRRRSTIAAFGTVDGELAVGGIPLRAAGRPRRLDAVLRLRPRAARPSASTLLRAALPERLELSYAMKANPMPAVVQHLAGLVDSHRRRVGRRAAARRSTPASARAGSASPARARRTPRSAQAVAAGRHHRARVGDRGRGASSRAGEELGSRPRVAVRVNPDFEVKGSGHADGRRAAAVRRRRRAGARAAGRAAARRTRRLGLPRLRRLAEPATPRSSPRPSGGPSTWSSSSPSTCPAPVRYLNLGGGFGIPYFDEDQPLDLAPSADNLADAGRRALIAERLPGGDSR